MKNKKMVLIVDDVELNRAFLRDMLEDEYEIIEAANGIEAVELLSSNFADIAVVLLDAIMPEMDGFEVLEHMNAAHWIDTIPVIMISADSSPEFISKGYKLGAIDYISRPYNTDIVMHRVKNTITLYTKQIVLQSIVVEHMQELQLTNSLMVDILSTIVEFRNGESGIHVQRIRILTKVLLEALVKNYPKYALTQKQIVEISNAAALHDVGKITIPDNIINKPTKLTVEEFEVFKTHCERGAQMLENIDLNKQDSMLKYAINICKYHHERWGGEGYPKGLVADEIPVCAQVVALADVYDALVSERVYKDAISPQNAVAMIINGECGSFNDDLLACFVQASGKLEDEICKYENDVYLQANNVKNPQEAITSKDLLFSSRTVALLEQERVKTHFFASLSNEIQFEYNIFTDVLSLSDKGAEALNLPLQIKNAIDWLKESGIIAQADVQNLFEQFRKATLESPIIKTQCLVVQEGTSPKWHEITIRILYTDEITPSISGCIGKMVDIHSQKIEGELLKIKAECDALTQLYNHAAAKYKIKEKLLNCGLSALLFFDIDDFKQINDTHGHLIGDAVLKQLSKIIMKNIRTTDIAARVGGDEFIIFVSDFADKARLNEWIERLWGALHINENTLPFTVSMGIAITENGKIDYETLVSQADQSLYIAKKNGKNQHASYVVHSNCEQDA